MTTPKPKLLVTTTTFPRFNDDIVPAQFVLQLSEHFCDDYTVHILAPHAPHALRLEKFGPITVSRFPYFYPTSKQILCDGQGILPNMRRSLLGKIQVAPLLGSEFLHLRRILHDFKPDIIHSHWAIPQGFLVSLLKPKTTPQILTIHSSDLHTLYRLPFGAKILNYVAHHCHTIFLVSSYLKNLFLQMVPKPPCELKVLPMGVDKIFFTQPPYLTKPKKKLLYIGKMIEVKGVKYLIDAMKLIGSKIPGLHLTLIGDGEERSQLETQAKQIDPQGKFISFLGQLNHIKLPEHLAQVDALIVPSIVTKRQETEGMPTVILEAISSGTPVLASQVGGLADTIKHRENGLLFEHSNANAIATTIITFYKQQLWQTMQEPARQSAQQFAWPQISSHYLHTFKQAC